MKSLRRGLFRFNYGGSPRQDDICVNDVLVMELCRWFSVADALTQSDIWVVYTAKKITRIGIEHSSTRILPDSETR